MESTPVERRPGAFRFRYLALAVLVVIVGVLAIAVLLVAARKPGKAGKFSAAFERTVDQAQAGSGLSGGANGWDAYLAVTQAFAAVPARQDKAAPIGWPSGVSWPPRFTDYDADAATDLTRRELQSMLVTYEKARVPELLDDVTAFSRFVRPIPEERLLTITLPELQQARPLAGMCIARMAVALEQGDFAEYERALGHGLTIAAIHKVQGTIIDELVGVAVEASLNSRLRRDAAEGRLPTAVCARTLERLLARSKPLDVSLGLACELLAAKDTIEWTHTDDGNGDGSFIPRTLEEVPGLQGPTQFTSSLPPMISNLGGLIAPSKVETLRVFEEFYERGKRRAALPFRLRSPSESLDLYVEMLASRQWLPRMLLPAIEHFVRVGDQSSLDIAATRITLALEVHRGRAGSYPATLAELQPTLEALGISLTWRPELIYRPESGGGGRGDAQGAYTFYWIGMDAVDHGGVENAKDPRAAWGSQKGLDLLFHKPASASPAAPTPEASPKP